MDKILELNELKSKKNEIIENLKKYYDEIYELNCGIKKITYDFPENYRGRQFKIINNEKVTTYGKMSLKKVDLYDCEIFAYQVKRNGTYYTNPEIVILSENMKLEWI
ncbi:hypothetical protein H3N56_12055 [Cetobacterium sp. 2A]|uniref:hypothetical protein n=1 Tax=unclassified Cetobacterium TaxID=2630983 RepID=UPI00163C9E29|nr:hypothetical protein [Cetobacterium sp. 2A]MBC2857168.1 hypothetical protein [Cetobacterium sp. 2A]